MWYFCRHNRGVRNLSFMMQFSRWDSTRWRSAFVLAVVQGWPEDGGSTGECRAGQEPLVLGPAGLDWKLSSDTCYWGRLRGLLTLLNLVFSLVKQNRTSCSRMSCFQNFRYKIYVRYVCIFSLRTVVQNSLIDFPCYRTTANYKTLLFVRILYQTAWWKCQILFQRIIVTYIWAVFYYFT